MASSALPSLFTLPSMLSARQLSDLASVVERVPCPLEHAIVASTYKHTAAHLLRSRVCRIWNWAIAKARHALPVAMDLAVSTEREYWPMEPQDHPATEAS